MESVMPFFLSDIDGMLQVAFIVASHKIQNHLDRCFLKAGLIHDTVGYIISVCDNAAGNFLLCCLRFRPSETHPNCNISRVDTL